MSRHDSKSPITGLLGYFLQGIPVVFATSDIALRSNARLVEFARFLDSPGKDPPLTPGLCEGYEHFVTVLHEIKHFHDALLCRPLFERFLLRNQASWCLAQIVSHIPPTLRKIPIDWNDPRVASIPYLDLLKEVIFASDEDYFHRFENFHNTCDFAGNEISVEHLLETNAIVAELTNLYTLLGVRAVRSYYMSTITRIPDRRYTLLLARFIEIYGDVIPAMIALYVAIPFCLYSSLNPAREFCELVKRCQGSPKLLLEICNIEAMANIFSDEALVEQQVNNMAFIGPDGPVTPNIQNLPNPEFARGLLNFHRTMYGCRKQLIMKYVIEYKFNSGLYFEYLDELPIPPVLFYPVHSPDKIQGAYEQEFSKHGLPLYTIAGHRGTEESEGRPIVFAGLTTLPGLQPSIRFDVADQQLVYAYFYKAAFEGTTSVYAPIVDHMYEQVYRTVTSD